MRSPSAAPQVRQTSNWPGDGVVRLLLYVNSGRSYDARWPPELAVCDLNLKKWRSLIQGFKIGEDAEDVIRGCRDGFHQGIPDHTLGQQMGFTPPNHNSAHQAAEKIENTLAKEHCAKRIFGPLTHQELFDKIGFFWSSTMWSVINGDGSFRIVNDLSFPQENLETPSVNSFVDKK